MTPASLHAAVLAALTAAQAAETAATPTPWQATDNGGIDAERGFRGRVVCSVGAYECGWPSRPDSTLIAALRNAAAAMLAGVRDIVDRHHPYDDRPSLLGMLCRWCSAQEGQTAFPCVDYQAAARMIPNLPEEVANALGHRP